MVLILVRSLGSSEEGAPWYSVGSINEGIQEMTVGDNREGAQLVTLSCGSINAASCISVCLEGRPFHLSLGVLLVPALSCLRLLSLIPIRNSPTICSPLVAICLLQFWGDGVILQLTNRHQQTPKLKFDSYTFLGDPVLGIMDSFCRLFATLSSPLFSSVLCSFSYLLSSTLPLRSDSHSLMSLINSSVCCLFPIYDFRLPLLQEDCLSRCFSVQSHVPTLCIAVAFLRSGP